MSITDNLQAIKNSLPEGTTLVAVSKTKPLEDILEAYESGHRDFGENKVQELTWKQEQLPEDIRWHYIGHLQRNKVKYLAPFVHLIHGVDSLRLLREIDKQGKRVDRVLECLLQVHIAREETKFGFTHDEVLDLLNADESNALTHVRISGLMGMATNTTDLVQVKHEFDGLRQLFDRIDAAHFHREVLSMGMTNDYPVALESGSNMIRIGSAIFGERNKP